MTPLLHILTPNYEAVKSENGKNRGKHCSIGAERLTYTYGGILLHYLYIEHR